MINRVVYIRADFRGESGGEGDTLARDVRREVELQNNEGYKVVSVTNTTGSYQSTDGDNDSAYAESYTCGVLIVFESIDQH
jgi:hypothetical protein